MKRKRNFLSISAFLILLFTHNALHSYLYTITNGTAYIVRVKIRGQASVYNLDDMIGDTQSNILKPGESRAFYIGYRIHNDPKGHWQGKDIWDGWNVGVCLGSLFVEFLQKDNSYKAIHPLTRKYIDPTITIKQITTDRYTNFNNTLQNFSDKFVENAKHPVGIEKNKNDASSIIKASTEAGLELTEALVEPETLALGATVKAVKEAQAMYVENTVNVVKELTSIYSNTLCRARDLFLVEVPVVSSNGKGKFFKKKFIATYKSGKKKGVYATIPETQFVAVTKDD